jgi:hypothetical protein
MSLIRLFIDEDSMDRQFVRALRARGVDVTTVAICLNVHIVETFRRNVSTGFLYLATLHLATFGSLAFSL